MSEDKKIIAFLIAISAILLFTFTAANHINEADRLIHKRTEHDMLIELRLEYNALMLGVLGLQWEINKLQNENRILRDMLRIKIIYEEMKNVRD